MIALGNYIDGAFVAPSGIPLQSHNPAADGAVVFETAFTVEAVGQAVVAAAAAQPAWARLSRDDRWAYLQRFKAAIAASATVLADAIVLETGKIRSEAVTEINSLLGRFDLVRAAMTADVKEGLVAPGETLRYQALGVVGVIGPFNFPLHLCHAHVVPALLAGNAVVIKPSDLTPLCGQRYAEAAHAAGLPPGVLNMVVGTGDVGAALLTQPALRGLCFTGSWNVGRRILGATLDRPEVLVALEMGGKNASVVLDDASLRQAVHEILIGGYLSAGQRCTGTDRVLVHRGLAEPFLAALSSAVRSLRFGQPEDATVFAGPVVSNASMLKLESAIASARAAGAEPLVEGQRLSGGSFRSGSLHLLPTGVHNVPGYTDVEVFGPDLGVEIVDSDEQAIELLAASPTGFASAVFTGSSKRFDNFFNGLRTGILNRNRSTNLASPRLPFGGVGTAGNYRPAGAWAHRNLMAPVAMLENVTGAVVPHPMLAAHLPPPDLARLEREHTREEAEEAARTLVGNPRPMSVNLPHNGGLPESSAWLARLHAADRVPNEKKPPVFDHLRSAGPWMVSIDADPLVVLDGMSQTATVCGGFAEDAVVQGFIEGRFATTVTQNDDTAVAETAAARDYADTLRQLVPGLPHVTFVAAGSEANEKAMVLCRINDPRPTATRVLAFEGGFHGRTLLALHATHSPAKRAPFEIAGCEATFAPFPVWDCPGEEPAAPSGFYAAAAAGDLADLVEHFTGSKSDPLLAAEVRALAVVHEQLATGTYFCCIVEPMQSEGGDRYATERFFRALRLLTRHHATSLIFDEVQTGFGLGGPFAWHSRFRLLSSRGQIDYPDAVTFAKRAQVGVVMSRFDDPEPASAHNASLVRGRIHAEMMSTSHAAARIEALVTPRLRALATAFPHLVGKPRGCGYAFAFDLPTPAHLNALIGQRFWRGAIVFGAGTRTARYRLSETFMAREVDMLFTAIRRSLSWVDAHDGQQPPAWENPSAPFALGTKIASPGSTAEIRYRSVSVADAMQLLQPILEIEQQVYEPARRTPPEEIRAALGDPEGSTVVAEAALPDGGWRLVGFALGAPLELSGETEGPDDDPMLGLANTMYSVSITVAEGFQGVGMGRRLKEMQLRDAAAQLRADQTPRYRYVSGRNRVGHTAQMTHLNRVFGAHVVSEHSGQYEDPEGQAIYYRIPLGPIAPDLQVPTEAPAFTDGNTPLAWDLASGLARTMATPPASLIAAERSGLLYGPVVNKLTLMNYATTAAIRAMEWISALVPELPHLYLTSGRDEAIDKALRLLRITRKAATVVIGLDGGYVGHTIASARSISDPAVHAGGPSYFPWPRVPHPATAGTQATIMAIRAAVEAAGGADHVLGFVYELVQERTGQVMPANFWPAISALRSELKIPLIAVETSSARYRTSATPFAFQNTNCVPDVMAWWGGGQTGYVHCLSKWFVAAPLALVSTWDGDELSLVREHHELRALQSLDVASASAALDQALSGVSSTGQGLYRVVEFGNRAADIVGELRKRGIAVRQLPNGRAAIMPPLDCALEASVALGRALQEIL